MYVHARSLLQLVLRVRKRAVGPSGTAALLTEVPAHAGLVLAVGLRLHNAQMKHSLVNRVIRRKSQYQIFLLVEN